MRETPQCKYMFRYDTDPSKSPFIHFLSISAMNEKEAIEKAKKKYPNTELRRVQNEYHYGTKV